MVRDRDTVIWLETVRPLCSGRFCSRYVNSNALIPMCSGRLGPVKERLWLDSVEAFLPRLNDRKYLIRLRIYALWQSPL